MAFLNPIQNIGIASCVSGSYNRWRSSDNPVDYSQVADAAFAYGQQLQTTMLAIIPPPDFNNVEEVVALVTASLTLWFDRTPTSINPSDYTQECDALAAMFVETRSKFT